MAKFKMSLKRLMVIMPILTIVGMSFYPAEIWVRQVLVLFILLWFHIFIFFDVLGK
jgi:hypothetical protein